MSWPVTPATKANLDAATDDPSQARAELVALIDSFNNLVSLLSKSGGNDKVLVTTSAGRLVLGGTDDGVNQLQANGAIQAVSMQAGWSSTQHVHVDNNSILAHSDTHTPTMPLYLQYGSSGDTVIGLSGTGKLVAPPVRSTTTTSAPNVFVDTDGTLKRSTAAFRGALATAGGQTVTTMATVDLTTTVYDTDSIVNLTNNTFTVPAGVTKVRLSGSCQFNTNTTYTHTGLFGKGASFVASVGARPSYGTGGGVDMHTGIITVSAGDYFTPRCSSSTSDTLNSDSWFQMEIIE